jgi:hypothetical protein
MAVVTYDQLAQTYGGLDVTFKNYGGSDIAANLAVALDATNYVGDSTSTHTVPGIVLPTAAGGDPTLCIGVTMETVKAGGHGRVRVKGIAAVQFYHASLTVAPGVMVDASAHSGDAGHVTLHTAAKASIGQTISGGASLDTILISVDPSLNA